MTITVLVVFGALLVIGVPIAYAIAGSALYTIWGEGIPLTVVAQRVAAGVQSFPLLAIPLFILAGSLMNESGISERLFSLTRAMVGHIRGGLGHVNVIANVLMAGVSGSSLADCAATTRVFVPQMIKNDYDKGFCVALTASTATLGPIIPPSILFVIYGWQANVSIGDMFVAGILPGLLIGGILMLTVATIAWRRQYPKDEAFSRHRLATEFKRALWALLMPVIIIVGFRLGVFTATEVAAAAAVYALVVGMFIYRSLKWSDLPRVLLGTARDASAILVIVGTSAPFAWVLGVAQAPQTMLEFTTGISQNPWVVLLILNLFLLVIGMFMETISVIIILVPILLPLLKTMGIDLVHFGVVLVFNLLIGQLTPPVGVLMFLVCTVAKTSVSVFLKAMTPFYIGLVSALAILTFVPGVSLLLPHLLRH